MSSSSRNDKEVSIIMAVVALGVVAVILYNNFPDAVTAIGQQVWTAVLRIGSD